MSSLLLRFPTSPPGNGTPLVISPLSGTLPQATQGVFYTATFTASGGVPPYQNWLMIGGPAWLTSTSNLDGTFTISGSPPSAQLDSFTIQVQDALGAAGQILFT